jgi:hypothetical protein
MTLSELMYSGMGLKITGIESFFEKECKVFSGELGKVLTWKGITMFLDLKMIGSPSHEEVTGMEINMPVSAEYFIIPDNIKFSEIPGI